MCTRKLSAILGVLLAAVSGFAAWAYVQYRDTQQELDTLRKTPRVVVNQVVMPDPVDTVAPMPRVIGTPNEVGPMPRESAPDTTRI